MPQREDLPPQQPDQEKHITVLGSFVTLDPVPWYEHPDLSLDDPPEEADSDELSLEPEDIEVHHMYGDPRELEEIHPKLREKITHVYDAVRQIYEKGTAYIGLTDVSKVGSIAFTREYRSFPDIHAVHTMETLEVGRITDSDMYIEVSKKEWLKRSDEDIKHDADRVRKAWGIIKDGSGLNLPDAKPDSYYAKTHAWFDTLAADNGTMNVMRDGSYGRVGWAGIEPDDIDAEADPQYMSDEAHFNAGYEQIMEILDKMLNYSTGLRIDVRYASPSLRQIDVSDSAAGATEKPAEG